MSLRCRLLTLVAVGVLVPAGVKAQSAVTMRGTVSETVAVAVLPSSSSDDVVMGVVSSNGTVRITMSGTGTKSPVIHVPLLVRSNSSFKISALFESNNAVLNQLSVTDVRATGRLVSPQIIKALEVNRQFDPNSPQPSLVLSGPRVSLGGTLNSPNNALQITLLIRLSPPTQPWTAQLTLITTK